jgi:uncharacterized membrane protein (GlpM family)
LLLPRLNEALSGHRHRHPQLNITTRGYGLDLSAIVFCTLFSVTSTPFECCATLCAYDTITVVATYLLGSKDANTRLRRALISLIALISYFAHLLIWRSIGPFNGVLDFRKQKFFSFQFIGHYLRVVNRLFNSTFKYCGLSPAPPAFLHDPPQPPHIQPSRNLPTTPDNHISFWVCLLPSLLSLAQLPQPHS